MKKKLAIYLKSGTKLFGTLLLALVVIASILATSPVSIPLMIYMSEQLEIEKHREK